MTRIRKKLIEVALPLDAINAEGSRRKRKAPAGYPTTLHKWWAQRPVAAARGVVFAQMVDDPSGHPDLFPSEEAQEKERQRLFRIIEELVKWENTTNETVLEVARKEIRRNWRRTCADNADHPRAKELFDPERLPAFHDPFAGSGALPLEAQRLGLEAHASDLNPVAVLISKAMIEIPPQFAGQPPVNPESRGDPNLFARDWKGAQGLAKDVRYYGKWMREEAEKRIGHLYPKVVITPEMVKERPDLKPYLGRKLTVIAWLWARTVKSPNPAFANVEVPLASTFMLSTKKRKEAYIEPVIENGGYRFTVKDGKPKDDAVAKAGTKLGRGANFRCLMSGTPMEGDYIKAEGMAGRIGARLMAIIAEGDRGRVYLAPTPEHEVAARKAKSEWRPEGEIAKRMTGGNCTPYGLTSWGDLFTDRQLTALTTFSDLVGETRERIHRDALAASLPGNSKPLRHGGSGATGYAEAVSTFLAIAIGRLADYGSSIATWRPKDSAMRSTMPRQAIQMAWDFAEGSPFGGTSSGFLECVQVVARVIDSALGTDKHGLAEQANACDVHLSKIQSPVISTDPPYYDNIGYADLSDFFYVWLRRPLRSVFPELFATLAVPKAEELVATPHRHGSKEKAEAFFLGGMTLAMKRLAEHAHPSCPVTIYYAFKQAETESAEEGGTVSTGWQAFLDAVMRAGFSITGTWPIRTEGDNRQIGIGANALASSIVLVCRKRSAAAPIASRREFVSSLKAELPTALRHLQAGNIAPVDLAQAAIGPGMAIYTRYGAVKESDGSNLSVRTALQLINQVLDETLAEQDGDFDSETRWALSWFEEFGMDEGPYGRAETLSTARNTSVGGLEKAGIVKSGGGKVRLLEREELDPAWDPRKDSRLTIWEAAQQLIRLHEAGGEEAAAELLAHLGGVGETVRELAYRLYSICERKKWAQEALAYNALVAAWPELSRLAHQEQRAEPLQLEAF